MKKNNIKATVCATALLLFLVGCNKNVQPVECPEETPPVVKSNNTNVAAHHAPPIPDNLRGQAAAEVLMSRWKAKHPDVDWEAEERTSRTFIPASDNAHLLNQNSQQDGHPYRNYSKQELLIWKRETERLVVAGSRIFHSADELDSTMAISCDMCHPNAANTHPETYPKYQTQIGKVILLRDMINWCLEQAARAPVMEADDARMRALEAYIISQRSGTKLEYGKH